MPRTSLRLILLSCALAACAADPDDQAIYDAMPRLVLTPTTEICAGRDDAPCQFVNAAIVAAAPDGRVAVADMMGELREFDGDARFVRTVGAFGGGPGEYRRLVVAGYDSAGSLIVLDQAGMRIQRFDPAGGVLGAATAPLLPGTMGVAVTGGRIALLALPGAAAVGDTVETRVVLVDASTGDTSTVPGLPEPAIATGDGTMFPMLPLFRVLPTERWAVGPDGALHAADADRLRILRRDADGTPYRVLVDLDVAPRPVTAGDIEAAAAKLMPVGALRDAAAAAQMQRQRDLAVDNAPKVHPFVTRLLVLDDGHLLARESAGPAADSVRWNAFTAEGEPVGHLLLPPDARVAGGRLTLLLVVAPGEDDVPRIVWYGARSSGP